MENDHETRNDLLAAFGQDWFKDCSRETSNRLEYRYCKFNDLGPLQR